MFDVLVVIAVVVLVLEEVLAVVVAVVLVIVRDMVGDSSLVVVVVRLAPAQQPGSGWGNCGTANLTKAGCKQTPAQQPSQA